MSFDITFQGKLSSIPIAGQNAVIDPNDITLHDLLSFQRLEYLVAEAWDTHDWDSIRHLLAPTLKMDLTAVNLPAKDMTAEEYIGMVKGQELHAKHMRHQSFMGGGYYEKISETEVIGRRQLMTVYLVHKDENHAEVEHSTTGNGMREVYFKKIDGEWKWGGNKVKMLVFGEGYERLPAAKNMHKERKHWH